MVKFKDFIINVKDYGGILTPPVFEAHEDAMLRVNLWIEEHEIIVLNIETVIVPDLHKSQPKYGSTSAYFEKGESAATESRWFQVFRVWFNE